jgi:hypothetical protein
VSGIVKSRADAEGYDGFEFVGMELITGLQGCRHLVSTVAVTADTVADGLDIGFGITQFPEDGFGELGPPQCVADPTLAATFFGSANIVEQGCGNKDVQFGLHLLANIDSIRQNSLDVVRAMGSSLGKTERMG